MLHNHILGLSACSVLDTRSLRYKLPLLRSPNFFQHAVLKGSVNSSTASMSAQRDPIHMWLLTHPA